MTDPVWPTSLGVPLLSGYGGSNELPLIRTEMEQGPQRASRLSDTYMTLISAEFMMPTRSMMQTFQSFFDVSCNAGADWIRMPIDTGAGIAWHRIRITSYSFSAISPEIRKVSLSIETEDRISEYG